MAWADTVWDVWHDVCYLCVLVCVIPSVFTVFTLWRSGWSAQHRWKVSYILTNLVWLSETNKKLQQNKKTTTPEKNVSANQPLAVLALLQVVCLPTTHHWSLFSFFILNWKLCFASEFSFNPFWGHSWNKSLPTSFQRTMFCISYKYINLKV